ncbi:MAG TPA: helix-turn-helix domain-containing protein [Ktedonobacteraceae bacterium]|jgi:predicted ATPase/DNA-binding CsgD family transcriptional regulator/transcriptional regulator with XRE-family HTH domain|nr:helix-turn-helix domain-containing protein [Ktedonobacteraceae bacterium]
MDYQEHVPNERLVRARLEKGWTQAQLAEEVGTTFETVSRWERGIVIPGLYYRQKLCRVFNKTATELGFEDTSTPSLAAGGARVVFLSSAYADAERKFVVSLKQELAMRDITVWSSGLVKRQSAHHKSGILEEAIRAVQLVLVILSPHSKGSTHVRHSRNLARHFKRPVCEVWIEGKSLEDCLPENYGEPGVVIDARQAREPSLYNQIIATIERVWLTPADPGTIELSEPMWNVHEPTRSLVGRDIPLAKASGLLRGARTRLITLTGPGGIGKTHLALHAAMETREHFVDGTCFVALTSMHDPLLVVPAIARELGIREHSDTPLLERIKAALKQKRFLLLLDNFEQVLEASGQLVELLAACPYLKMIVTSRTRLPGLAQRDDEARFVLLELDTLDLDAAVALFEQRARAARSTFEITPTNRPAIIEICERLDKLPLAIELAAARIGSLSPQGLLERLKQHPRATIDHILVDVEKDSSDRQHSLQNTIGWSYHSLGSSEQCLFRRLSVFAGSCALEAVEAVCEAVDEESGDVWKHVESLLNKSLLRPTEQKGEGRLYLLETIRDYALERLKENGEYEVTHRAHAAYYLRLAEEAEPHLKDEQQASWLEKLEREVENLRTTLDWFITNKEEELALRFCAALGRFWRLYGYWSEGRRWLQTALSLSPASDTAAQSRKSRLLAPTADVSATGGSPLSFVKLDDATRDSGLSVASTLTERARALYAAGDLAYYQDDNDEARKTLAQTAELSRAIADNGTLALALSTLGLLMHVPDSLAIAHAMLEESEQLCRNQHLLWELAYVLRRIAQHYVQDGYLKQAIDAATEGLTMAKKLGDRSLAAYISGTLGEIAARQSDIVQAIAYNCEGLSFARDLNDKHLMAITLNNLDYFSALQGEPTLGSNALDALKLARELGDQLLVNKVLNTLGYTAIRQGNFSQALVWYREALSHAIELDSKERTGWNLYGLALVAGAEGQHAQVARLLGAVEKWMDIATGMLPAERVEYTRLLENAQHQLGKRAFAAARSEGRQLTPTQVLVAPRLQPVVGTPPPPNYPDGLTHREVQMLCMISEGLTYREIASRLHLSPRTVNTYLTRAYSKISVSRTQVSAAGETSTIASRIAAARYVEEHDLC